MDPRTQIPLDYDPEYIATKAGITGPWGYQIANDHMEFVFPVASYEAVIDVIDNYKTYYLEIAVPAKLAELAVIRQTKVQSFTYGGIPMKLDTETICNITAAVVGLDRNQNVLAIDWEISRGTFITLDRATIYGIADAAFIYVESCFTHAKELTAQINAAADTDALAAIDLTAGWPTGT